MSSVVNDLRKKTNEELTQIITKLKTKLLEIKFSIASGEEDKVDNAAEIRKTIARALTIINERELNINNEIVNNNKTSKKGK
ncbi:MAG: 50S ribosomal protein L29 [Candidatus Ureaplasma intestinipullorum]|uniref:Large ribosomal subunit protein uL29 n=1 Tax=Candidatus Ureaplasma intestinipullorum TaxID=2838770 RepID=A0A9E2NW33_9BACT|nr:50S ribosomal protein L29 [Candidatus Ureaplasma intestinipullorum]